MTFSTFHKLSQYRFLFEELVERGFNAYTGPKLHLGRLKLYTLTA